MRSRDDRGQERPAPWPAAGDQRPEPPPDAERPALVHGPQTPAERAAARRRLDRLADGR